MTDKKITIAFTEYSSMEELCAGDKALAQAALEAQKGSYAPYSHFNVGAAVLLKDGTVVIGSNQENAATPSGLCAERTALFAAGAQYPNVPIVEIALAGGPSYTLCDEPATPCGACRQVMAEYQKIGGEPIAVLMVGGEKIWRFNCVDDILPLIFKSMD